MTDQTLLPWQELFSSHYLLNMDSRSNTTDIPSQDDICVFLEEGILRVGAVKNELELAKTACTHWASVCHPQHSQATATLENFHHNSNIQVQVHDILTKISEWKLILQFTQKKNKVSLSRDILSMIKELKTDLQKQFKSNRFFSALEDMLFTGTGSQTMPSTHEWTQETTSGRWVRSPC